MRLLPKMVLVLAALLVPASAAHAASGIKLLSPKAGATISAGERPTFKLRVKGSGQVYVHVCKTKRKDAKGVICDDESIGRAKRGKAGVFTYRPEFFDFPEFWLNSPGTYYWQAYRIACEGQNTRDCLQESKINKVKVG